MKRRTKVCLIVTAACLLATLTGCFRDLWVFQDRFKQIELVMDWRNYYRDSQRYGKPDPDGMTVWIYPNDGREAIRTTTSQVRRYETYLSKGDYDALVIDYSPEEYSHQAFVGMESAETAKVETVTYTYQPNEYPEIYGADCYGNAMPIRTDGFCIVAWEPEDMACDSTHITAITGDYDRYIPYEERDTYQLSLIKQTFEFEPLVIPWYMRVRIYIKGIYYLYQVKGSIAGLADGYYLMQDRTSSTPCLMALDDWEVHVTGDNVGYIAKTFRTWGVQNASAFYKGRHLAPGEKAEGVPQAIEGRPASEIRLNLRLLLRDRKTVCTYHFDVGDQVRAFWNEYALRIDLMDGFPGQPDLPFVEAYNGVGIGGIVTPWEPQDTVEIIM